VPGFLKNQVSHQQGKIHPFAQTEVKIEMTILSIVGFGSGQTGDGINEERDS
jgi:hypothetical protein